MAETFTARHDWQPDAYRPRIQPSIVWIWNVFYSASARRTQPPLNVIVINATEIKAKLAPGHGRVHLRRLEREAVHALGLESCSTSPFLNAAHHHFWTPRTHRKGNLALTTHSYEMQLSRSKAVALHLSIRKQIT